MAFGLGALIGGGLSAISGMYGANQASKSASNQMDMWQQMNQPQMDYMKQLYPQLNEQMQAYTPYYQQQLAQQQQLMDPQTQLALGQIAEQQKMLPYANQMMEQMYMPMMQSAFQGIQDYGAQGVQPWEKQAISQPFQAARTKAGERAAGSGTLRSGPTQKLAALYDSAEAQALTQLPYQRQQQNLQNQMGFLGYTPQAPNVSAPSAVNAPQVASSSVSAMPQPYQPQQLDTSSLGMMMGMQGWGAPEPQQYANLTGSGQASGRVPIAPVNYYRG